MLIGTQLHAPEGLGSLSKGHVYYLLASRHDPARVLLVYFWQTLKRMKTGKSRTVQGADLIALPRAQFEDAIDSGQIREHEKQQTLPPWLGEFEGMDLKAILQSRPKDAIRVADLERKVQAAVQKLEQIVTSRDPVREINKLAATFNMHTGRYRLALCSYLLFGGRPEVLISQKFRSGRSDREALPIGTKKLGRPSGRHGKGYGQNLRKEHKDIIDEYYRSKAKLGVKKTRIYRDCMVDKFGCRSRGTGWQALYHPEGKAFPTRSQFDYVLKKRIGTRAIHVARFGSERVRNRSTGSRGSFTEHIGSLHECLESDGYTSERHPTGITGELLPKLTVVRVIDRVSRMRVGIGFSLNGERKAAYEMAMVCMAMDKVGFCARFGIEIKPEEWPSRGWPTRSIVDRGPGSVIDEDRIAFSELAQAYAGQAKAIVESSHRRTDHVSGGPSHLRAPRSPIQLAAEEIHRLLIENKSVEVKRTPRMIAERVLPVPVGVWTYLERYGRVEGCRVDEQSALRLLSRIEVRCSKNGIEYHGEIFRSDALRESGLLDFAARQGRVTVNAFVMPMCIRQFWIEWKDRLIEVTWSLPFDDGIGQTYLTLNELQALHRRNREDKAALREHQDAVAIEMTERFDDAFGRSMGTAIREAGRAKVRTKMARAETRAIGKIAEGR